MIRFHCPDCDRPYLLPDALFGLPLLCKGCGKRLNVPAPSADPDPLPDLKIDTPPPPEPLPPPDPKAEAFLSPTTRGEFDLKLTAPDDPDPPAPPKPAPPPAPVAAPQPARRGLGVLVDVAVGVALAGGGALLGELAARRPTADILREAGSAAKFPPLDLLVWGGCVAVPVLAYALLANRGTSVGAWLRRRG